MSNPAAILDRCRQLGLKVWVEGDRLGIAPTERIPPGLLDEIREAKPALLPLVREGGAQQDKPDADLPTTEEILRHWPTDKPAQRPRQRGGSEKAWLAVACQVNAGEFVGADASTIETLFYGLRSLAHPSARAALRKVADEPACPANVRNSILSLLTP
jgi:hypothetical protein